MSNPDRTPAADERSSRLTHIDEVGRARMVDVSAKAFTERHARARCRVVCSVPLPEDLDWPELFAVARVAGTQAAKQTALLIPLCHPLAITAVSVAFVRHEAAIDVEAESEVVAQTGVEMEALTACAIAALSLTAALVGHDRDCRIEDLALWEKRGGRSGHWHRAKAPGA